jgi:hypothetical protein
MKAFSTELPAYVGLPILSPIPLEGTMKVDVHAFQRWVYRDRPMLQYMTIS